MTAMTAMTAPSAPSAMSAVARSTTLQTAASQSTGAPIVPPPRRRSGLVLGGVALAAIAAAATVFVVRRDPGGGPAAHAPLAGASGDAREDVAIPPAGATADAAAGVTADATDDAEGPTATNLPELRQKVRDLAAAHDWYTALQLADLDRDDPEIASVVANAKQQYVAQQARAIDAQVKQGQCTRAKDLAATAHKVVADDTTLEARARACKPHVASPPAPPATLEDATQAFAAGDFSKAFEIADKLARSAPSDYATTRLAALAACGAKNVDAAASYAALLRGADRIAARTLCLKNSIELGKRPGPGAGKDNEPGKGSGASDGASDDALDQAQDAAKRGEWAEALARAESVLSRAPRNLPAVTIAATAACHLKKDQKARAMIKRLPPARQRALRQLCTQEGVLL